MNDTWQQPDQHGSASQPSGLRGLRRPRRSRADRKIAGVAGGLGRALGIDPVVFRVAFVVLTVFGGFGGLLYVLGWLFLADDGDEVSAAEALAGRGRSSVTPALAVGLAVVAGIAGLSMFSWGLPFLPLAVAAVVVGYFVTRNRNSGTAPAAAFGSASRLQEQADQWGRQVADRAGQWGDQAGAHAEKLAGTLGGWGRQVEEWVKRQPWAGSTSCGSTGPDPAQGPDLTKSAPPTGAPVGTGPAPTTTATPTTPPAWDPLGVAPFAWDLPEPTPADIPVPTPTRTRTVEQRGASRVTSGLASLGMALVAAGIVLGWWDLPWAFVTGVGLAVVGLGLVVISLFGRARGLVGHGITLALLTLVLGWTGLAGTAGFGHHTWTPTTVAELESPYVLNAGYGELDLSGLVVPAGTEATVKLEVRAGNGEIAVPANTTVNATCTVRSGETRCLDAEAAGLNREATATLEGSRTRGVLHIELDVRAGRGEVKVP